MDLSFLPDQVRCAFSKKIQTGRFEAQELRFRRNRPVTVVYPWGEQVLDDNGRHMYVTDKLLEEILARATGFSPYSLRLEETGLFLPLKGGCRMGLCGEAVVKEGKLSGLRTISSLSVRLAREKLGIAGETADRLLMEGNPASALIVSPPGGGKTTFLRDLIRCISQKGYRVAVVDERRELGADGALELGPTTDVLTGAPKVQAIPLLIRAMNPQVLALDEISGEAELEEALYASFSGIALLATAHGDGKASLYQRPLYRKLLRSGAFGWIITLEGLGKPRMERLRDYDAMDGRHFCYTGIPDGGMGGPAGAPGAPESIGTASIGAGADGRRDGTEYAPPQSAF